MTVISVQVGRLEVGGDAPVRVMGVINLSRESFYSGSIVDDYQKLIEVLNIMEKEGADIIDVGAASTAPSNYYGDRETTLEKELERVKRFVRIICDNTNLPVSIDTKSPKVAEMAIDLGAQMINDVTGLSDDGMVRLAAEREVPVIIMADCGGPCSSVENTIETIKRSIERAIEGGVKSDKIIIDPGIGFGKPPMVDFEIIKHLTQFHVFNLPVLVGVSRKAFIGALLDQPDPKDRLEGTIAVTAVAVANGAHVIRAHDVREAWIAARVGETLRPDGDHH